MSSPSSKLEMDLSKRFISPCILVIFGATGDLTARKLLPAIYNLRREGQLPSNSFALDLQEDQKPMKNFEKK